MECFERCGWVTYPVRVVLWLLQHAPLAVTRVYWVVRQSVMDLSVAMDTTSMQTFSALVSDELIDGNFVMTLQ